MVGDNEAGVADSICVIVPRAPYISDHGHELLFWVHCLGHPLKVIFMMHNITKQTF
jgi:hypothetical protein